MYLIKISRSVKHIYHKDNKMNIRSFFFVNVIFFVHVVCEEAGPVVKTNQGLLKGTTWVSKKGRDFQAFTGIPYAKPPLGKLRFAAPVPGDAWEGIRDATQVHSVCPQRDIYRRSEIIEGDEDCLYLNVYTPKLEDAGGEPLPVMVFFHGGGWLCGGGNSLWYGPHVLLDRDVVLVVVNYRLGALGFLSTGDEVVPGNNGLKDQNLALKWVKVNIKAFGGNPNSVTIFGESAGGSSAHFHMLSKMSAGMFNAVISQSGTALSIWALAPNGEGIRNSKKLAQLFNCPTKDSTKMVECLRHVDALKIIEQDVHFMEWDFDPMIPFKPVVEPELEGAFLSKHPIEIIKSGKFSQVPWMLGINTQDGALRATGILANPHLLDDVNNDFEKVIPISLMYKPTASDVGYVTRQIRKFYFNDQEVDTSLKDALIDLYTDAWFLSGADEAIRLHLNSSSQPIYYYLFGHRGVSSFSEIFGDPVNDYGVCHADELLYLFPISDGLFPDKKFSEKDKKVTDIMTFLWSNFAKYRNPTPQISDLITEKWDPVQSEKMEYYYISSDYIRMKRGLFSERAEFWRSLPIRGTSASAAYVKEEL